jgi:hypothetical protein
MAHPALTRSRDEHTREGVSPTAPAPAPDDADCEHTYALPTVSELIAPRPEDEDEDIW